MNDLAQTEAAATADTAKLGDTFAAIDLGSNSFHLIVARLSNGTLQPMIKDKQMVRLGEGLDAEKNLSEEAIRRGLDVLRAFATVVRDMEPSCIRVVGTYTLRRANNRNHFLRLAREIFPFPIEVISGDEEARLIYQGVAHTTHSVGRRLVVDIGGGSTEFVIGEQFDTLQLSSLPMGCISYTAKFFADGKIDRERFRDAQTFARQRLEIIDQRFRHTGWDAAIGTSGTVRAILQYGEHHKLVANGVLHLDNLKEIRRRLIQTGQAERIEGVEDNRKSVLAAGLAILIAVFKQLRIMNLTVNEAALREGVLYELTERMQHHDIRERTVDSLVKRYDIDRDQSRRIQIIARQLFTASEAVLPRKQHDALQRLLDWAADLHELGLHINRRALQRHSCYIIENTEMPGFSDEEQRLLALLVGTYRKRFDRKSFTEYSQYDATSIFLLVVIFRLATLLSVRRQDGFLPPFSYSGDATQGTLSFPDGWLADHQLVRADLESEAMALSENAFQLSIS